MYKHMFEVTNEEFKNYLKCPQFATVRIEQEKTQKGIMGLCTDGMSACVGIVIVGENTKRLSLTHTDLAVHENAIADECAWIGSPCKMFIIKGTNYSQPGFEERSEFKTKTMPRFQKKILEKGIEIKIDTGTYYAATGAVAVTCNGEIKIPIHNGIGFNRIGQAAPGIEIRHSINAINAYVLQINFQFHTLDVQYDGSQWTKSSILTPLSNEFIEKFKKGDFVPSNLSVEIKNYLQIENCLQIEKQDQLKQKTSSFFSDSPANWKEFPANKLIGKYVGHKVLFFTMGVDRQKEAEDFAQQLVGSGFQAELKKAKDKPSIVVDLTMSVPSFK